MGLNVVKRDGSIEAFDIDKIANSIFNAAVEAGGDDFDLAEELADKVEEVINTNLSTDCLSTSSIQEITEKVLIEEGHTATSKAYILKSADRERMRSMDTALMKSFEEITFKSAEESEVKRENANIDSSTAMGTMLKYGAESAKSFNLLYLMSNDIANAHRNGDIHIHDLDFLSLTETCVTADTSITIKQNGTIRNITVAEFFSNHNIKENDNWKNIVDENIEILSKDGFTRIRAIVKHSSDNKEVIEFTTLDGTLKVTNEHIVTVKTDNGKFIDKKAKDVDVGETIVYVTLDNNDCTSYNVKGITIKGIDKIEYNDDVYDFETENHYFTANGFNVHNCCQIPLDKLFTGGFNTGHGFLREPGNIRTAGALSAIAIQSNQNDQHKSVA